MSLRADRFDDETDPDPPPERERSHSRASELAETRGLATDLSPSSFWSGIDRELLRPHMLRAAAGVLTDKQLESFTAWLGGEAIVSIAERLGTSHQAVSQSLLGTRQSGGTSRGKVYGGALKRVQEYLIEDADFLVEVAASKAGRGTPDVGLIVRSWFSGLGYAHLDKFVPLSVLLVLFFLSDARGDVTFGDAHAAMPAACVSHALPTLKALGFVTTDGVTIRIRKTPVEVKR